MYRLWAEMVWAEMVMGRNGHGPKWLWAEMTSDRFGPDHFGLDNIKGVFVFPKTVSVRFHCFQETENTCSF